jgi:hypothetical protein
MKYNIVLIPNSDEVGLALISLTKKISIGNGMEPDYFLKDIEQLSIPHVSVIQFEIEENLLTSGIFGSGNQVFLESIWKQVFETWQEVLANAKELICTLPQTINYKHDILGTFAGVSWSEIIINKISNPLIQQFHDKLREKLAPSPLSIKCLNASGEHYNPHFTLFNIRTSLLEQDQLVKEIPESYLAILKSFSIRPALGVANNNWEFTRKLKEEKPVTEAPRVVQLSTHPSAIVNNFNNLPQVANNEPKDERLLTPTFRSICD